MIKKKSYTPVNKKVFLKLLILFFLTAFNTIFSQTNQTKKFSTINNSEIKKEVSCFTISGAIFNKIENISNDLLIEILLSKCNDTIFIFEKVNNIYFDKLIDIFVSDLNENDSCLFTNKINKKLDTSTVFPKKKIKAIYVLHGKIKINIPEDSYNDIFEPTPCVFSLEKKYFSKKKYQSNCKVFQTNDSKRMYIYMINGSEKNKYEVTWIIENNKYLMRIIDSVN